MVWLLACDWAPQGRAEAGGQLRDPRCFRWGDEAGLEQRSCAKSREQPFEMFRRRAGRKKSSVVGAG